MSVPVFRPPVAEPVAAPESAPQVKEPALLAWERSSTHLRRLRVRHLAKARAVDAGRSVTSAVYLYCHSCMGEDDKPRNCQVSECPLWRYRPGACDTRSPNVPTEADYLELQEYRLSLLTPEQLEARARTGARLKAARNGGDADLDEEPEE